MIVIRFFTLEEAKKKISVIHNKLGTFLRRFGGKTFVIPDGFYFFNKSSFKTAITFHLLNRKFTKDEKIRDLYEGCYEMFHSDKISFTENITFEVIDFHEKDEKGNYMLNFFE